MNKQIIYGQRSMKESIDEFFIDMSEEVFKNFSKGDAFIITLELPFEMYDYIYKEADKNIFRGKLEFGENFKYTTPFGDIVISLRNKK